MHQNVRQRCLMGVSYILKPSACFLDLLKSSPTELILLSTGCCAQLCDWMSHILPNTQSADLLPHVQVAHCH